MATIRTDKQASELARYLFSSKRTEPVIVLTTNLERTGPVVSLYRAEEVLQDIAKVFWVTGACQKHFNRSLVHMFGIEPSGVRLYWPRMSSHDHPNRHDIWNEQKIAKMGSHEQFLDFLQNHLRDRLARQHTKKSFTPVADCKPEKATREPTRKVLSLKINS